MTYDAERLSCRRREALRRSFVSFLLPSISSENYENVFMSDGNFLAQNKLGGLTGVAAVLTSLALTYFMLNEFELFLRCSLTYLGCH